MKVECKRDGNAVEGKRDDVKDECERDEVKVECKRDEVKVECERDDVMHAGAEGCTHGDGAAGGMSTLRGMALRLNAREMAMRLRAGGMT